jgi:hypothetical protein
LTAVADAALFVHLFGAFLFVVGIIVAGIAHGAAKRCDGASEAALLLAVARTGALLLAIGAVFVLAFGLWLVDLRGHTASVRRGSSAPLRCSCSRSSSVRWAGAARAKPGYWRGNSHGTMTP